MNKEDVLNSIFNDDPLGLLNVKPKKDNSQIEEERQSDAYKEIEAFTEQYGHRPRPNMNDMNEYKLYSRMMSMLDLYGDMAVCEPAVSYGVSKKNSPRSYASFDDIFNSDSLSILNTNEENLFKISHFNRPIEREETDFVAKRKPCNDFEKYEQKFKDIQKDLKSGKRKLLRFEEKQMVEGHYFVHNGILLLLEKIDNLKQDKFGKMDSRTRVIFENGTESNMKFRSLGKNLFENGFCVSGTNEEFIDDFDKNFNLINEDDKESGYIYVLSSLSERNDIKSIKNLYKIGFTTQKVEDRIKNAENEPTYLMAPVHYIESWKCYNMNVQKFEDIIHKFFGKVCLNIDIFDKQGKRFSPREWFVVPLNIIERVIPLIANEEISNYEYDEKNKRVVMVR